MTTGLDAQLGFKSETTVGTGVTVDQFHPGFLSESIVQEIQQIPSAGLRAGRRLRACIQQGTKLIQGSVETELFQEPLATLLTHMLGSVSTTGAGPYTHTATAGSLNGKAMTIQVGRPADDGTVHPFTYAGCKINGWTLSANVGEIVTLNFDFLGMSETTATGLATASYAAGCPFTFVDASLTIGGAAQNQVKSIQLTGSNSLSHRVRMGSATSTEPVQNGFNMFGGSVVADFEDLTNYNLFVNGTESALVATFSDGTNSLTCTYNVQFSGSTPTVSGPEMLEQPLQFEALDATADADALSWVLINGEATAI